MFYLAGILVALMSILASVLHLKQSIFTYFDTVAFLVVIGGTIAIAIITLPWSHLHEIKRGLKSLLTASTPDLSQLVQECLRFVTSPRGNNPAGKLGGIAGEVLRDGDELISLGFSPEKIRTILTERIYQYGDRYQSVANSFRGLAKYPPAFGLVGTVLGLVSLMRAISDGANSQETGIRMAVALVATLYGLLISNLIVNPAGESLVRAAKEEKHAGEIALQAVLLAAEGGSLLEAQEMLNSFVSRKSRVNILFDTSSNEEAA